MQNPIPAPPTTSPTQPQPKIPEMPSAVPTITDDPTISTSLLDWSDFLDFNLDDPFTAFSFDSNEQREKPITQTESEPVLTRVEETGRVRKRDPRMVCSNFLAGRIPCACPEIDEQLAAEEEEEKVLGGPGKKRARTVRIPAGSRARCQVPGCEADITELKGYHRRHRVCLRCATAITVVVDGQNKRYCQQCGKFHVLSDFDEGKRSCRRKLERHNNRRRRKPSDGKGIVEIVEKESQQTTFSEDISCDDDLGKDDTCLSSQRAEKETLVESDGQISTLCSARDSQNIQSDSILSFGAIGETQIDGEKENPKFSHSPSYCDNRSTFTSMCPTGRISFKLYDWNPAEFPRRLRHQIFQWLASMPVELEGYIRPGCTILTVFIAMPVFMWVKLSENPAVHLHDFVVSPGNMLSGRGTFFAYLNNMKFSVTKDGTSVMEVKVKQQVPKLHYVHPTFFEAGKPMEFIACGNNLIQPKLRFLVSFAGKYLPYDLCVSSSSCCETEEDTSSLNHQLLKISIPHIESNLFGPAFVEVENECGLSNFIPVLIGDKEICAEMKIMQQRFDAFICSKRSDFEATSSSCQVSILRQTEFSEFLLDVAWLLKKPVWETMQLPTSTHIRRIYNLLTFLIKNESTAILDRVLYYVQTYNLGVEIADTDKELLRTNVDNAKHVLCHKLWEKGYLEIHSRRLVVGGSSYYQSYLNDLPSVMPFTNQGPKITGKPISDARMGLTSLEGSAVLPLLNKKEVVMSVNIKDRPAKSCSPLLTKTVFTSRPLIFVITAVGVCFGICAAILHPQEVGQLATTIRRCLLQDS